MSHLLEFNIPLRLQCYRVPAVWHWEAVKEGFKYRYTIAREMLTFSGAENLIRAEQFDPWEMRLKFLDVDLRNPVAVSSFLNNIGLFAPAINVASDDGTFVVLQGEDGRHPITYEPERTWNDDEDFWTEQEFCRNWPCHLKDSSEATFDARVAPVGGAPTQFITVTNFYDAFQVAFAIDQARKAKRARCKRPTCGKTYTFTGNRKRLYCSKECGHYMAVRAFREQQHKKKVGNRSTPKRRRT